ncbi:hypothetical protein BD289DRAFT_484131 [Coniella lustricola]|uniref:Uncharacterized protein n=1 Tax=Coniella lustricola TaxID=2025994 RepID=A0A2T3A323_9PEZI|nr:hypothetical protein BD289DRAFT_484131 [Coniella lustricola]
MAASIHPGPEGFPWVHDAVSPASPGERSEPVHEPRPVPAHRLLRDPTLPSFHPARQNEQEAVDETLAAEDLRQAHLLHIADLQKTQTAARTASACSDEATVLVLVKYPSYADELQLRGCRYSVFENGMLRLTMDQVLKTGSELLRERLHSDTYQQRARKAAAPLPRGVTHVLNLSPTTDEEDLSLALQYLSVSRGVKLWFRSLTLGVAPLAVSGHDDVCDCLLPPTEPYPFPKTLQSPCLFDGDADWPLEDHRDIPEFCTTRWAANTIRLFRHISQPAGHKDILIDSAPRMWTLVGLFRKLGMTNHDLLRDEVTAWFNTDHNYLFLEMLPEETLQIGLALRTPSLSEPAFRILVTERALEVAGGQPRAQARQTIFGRHCSGFAGADDAESISRMIDHAGTAMADRYKTAIDTLLSTNVLDLLGDPVWKEFRALHMLLPQDTAEHRAVRCAYDDLMDKIVVELHEVIAEIVTLSSIKPHRLRGPPLPGYHGTYLGTRLWREKEIDALRAFSIPADVLKRQQGFDRLHASLNKYQRALCPFIWQHLLLLDMANKLQIPRVKRLAVAFNVQLKKYMGTGLLQNDTAANLVLQCAAAATTSSAANGSNALDPLYRLYRSIRETLHKFISPLLEPEGPIIFRHTTTPHMLLTANDHEMNFLRLLGDESRFQPDVPETDFGASGPGPAFHTGRTVPSVSDLDFEHLAVESQDDASTVLGSVVAQDGISTVHNRRRVLAHSSELSSLSDSFSDMDMEAEFRDAVESHRHQQESQPQPQSEAAGVEALEADHIETSEDDDDNELPEEFYDSGSETDDFELIM